MSPENTDEVGRRFRVVETLGRGGFGVVYRAEATSQGGFTKQVALKVLRKDVDLAGGVAERLRDEARILGLLNHRAIVKVDGLVELENGWAVVMEYVPGVNLTHVVKVGCPERAAAEIVAEVAGALHAAWHDVNDLTGEPLHLVHRDIKPANIRITAQGEVKVLDFGVARAEFADREAETVSMLFGSMRYMAPERLDGIEGPASDVYALAIVFAELLTGMRFDEPPKHPGRHGEWEQHVRQAVQDALPDDTPEATAKGLDELLERALAYEPEPRPSAGQLRATCRRLARSLPGDGLAEFAEKTVPTMERYLADARSRKEDDAIDSVLLEHGSPSMRAEVTGITRSRALVGGVLAGFGVAGVSMAVAGALVLVLLLWGIAQWASQAPAPVAAAPHIPPPPIPAIPEPEPQAMPAPEPAPEPVAPAPPPPSPAPARPVREAPPPAPKEPPPTAGTTLTLTGDVATVNLVGPSSHTLRAGANTVPPGAYAVKAGFDGGAPEVVSHITVPDGAAVLHCSQMLYTCRIQ